uniref:IL-3 receptor alpha chain N-terminal domain-containing protein n=1 Tax=Sus scrofa TaxID=9823 RepID=A0A4X1TCH4_PIG
MAFLWLAVLLMPVSCLLSVHQGRTSPRENDPDAPIRNLRIEPESGRLSWDLHGNVSEITCYINSKREKRKAQNNRYCAVQPIPCSVTNYTVSVNQGPPFSTFSTWLLYPEPEGNPKAAANLTCWIHDVHFLTCRWARAVRRPRTCATVSTWRIHCGCSRGRAGLPRALGAGRAGLRGAGGAGGAGARRAPLGAALGRGDRSARHRSHQMWECVHDEADPRGTHFQCRFDISALSDKLGRLARFLVNGSTSSGSRIPCSELTSQLSPMEILTAPNITNSWCNQSYAIMRWSVQSNFNFHFKYEVQIQKGEDQAYSQEVERNSLWLYNPGTYTVKIRAKDASFNLPWGDWSAPQRFVCDGEKGTVLPAWLTSLLIALGMLLALGLVLLLCRRFSVRQKLLPPIPHLKDPISDNLQNERMMAWDPEQASREECPVAEVQVLGET